VKKQSGINPGGPRAKKRASDFFSGEGQKLLPGDFKFPLVFLGLTHQGSFPTPFGVRFKNGGSFSGGGNSGRGRDKNMAVL